MKNKENTLTREDILSLGFEEDTMLTYGAKKDIVRYVFIHLKYRLIIKYFPKKFKILITDQKENFFIGEIYNLEDLRIQYEIALFKLLSK